MVGQHDAVGRRTGRRLQSATMVEMAPVDVVVCDDHAVFAEAMASALRADDRFAEITWSNTAEGALRLIDERRPALALVDLRMPDVDGIELVATIAELEQAPKILVLSVADDVRSVLAVFEAGANGFLGKHESFAVVADAAIAVMAGDAPISASAFARLLPRLIGSGGNDVLTGRESRVLELVADGRSNDDIATELGISVNTVRNHVSNVLRKLDVDNRGQAVIEARRRGAISGGT